MVRIPPAAEPLVKAIRGVFTKPTLDRFIVLMGGLIVTMGRHTVSRAIKAVEPKLQGHWCNYHRIFSSAKYSMWSLASALTRQVIALLPADVPIILLADDTVDGKAADHVWAKGAHRDAVRSSGSKDAIKFGHKWLGDVRVGATAVDGAGMGVADPVRDVHQPQGVQGDQASAQDPQPDHPAITDADDAVVSRSHLHFDRGLSGGFA